MTRDATLGTSAAWEPNKSLQQQPIRRRHHFYELPATCLERIFGYLSSRSDLVHAALVCRAWTTPALKLIWANFRFVRERDFERVFSIMARQNVSRPYGTYVKALDLVHADREFLVSPNVILLVTALCPNLESISITIHHTRPVAPPVVPPILQNRPVLPPIRRPGDAQPVRPQPPAAPNHQLHNNHHANNIRSPPQPQPINNNNHQHPPHQQQQQHPHPPQQQQQQRQYNHSLPLAHFAHNCRKLKTIRLTSYTPKTDDSVYEMAKYMQSGTLESIMLTGCGTLQSSTLVKLAITNPQLRHIEIMGNTPVSDSSLRALAERCGPHLESISIGNAYNLTDKSIAAVAKYCRNLKLLKLFNNADGNRLSEATLLDLLERCIHLRLISLSNARILGESFFAIAAQRVEHQLGVIEKQHGMSTHSGLQSMCLGGVKRQIIDGPSLAHLIDMSASKNDNLDDDDDDDDDNNNGINGNGTTITSPTEHTLAPTPTHVPKTTVIRGNTVWWQRRRPVLSKPS